MLCLPCDTNFVGWTAKELKRFATQCLGVVTPTRNNSGVEVKAVFRKYRERVGTRSTREEMETWSREKLNAQAKLYGIVVYPSFSSAHLRDEIEGFHVQVSQMAFGTTCTTDLRFVGRKRCHVLASQGLAHLQASGVRPCQRTYQACDHGA